MGEIKVTDDNCKTTADDVKVRSFVIIAVVGLAYQQIFRTALLFCFGFWGIQILLSAMFRLFLWQLMYWL